MSIKKHIPNTITCCNLISGCIAITFAYSGNFLWAFLWIIMGAVFDFFDGMTARLLHVSSPIGKELDSLADCVTFGVAPSMMVFSELCVMDYPVWMEAARPFLPYVAFVMAAFSALRLAKFNLDERQAMGFIGLPTPANALFWGSVLNGMGRQFIESNPYMTIILVAWLLFMSWLLVAEIPMFALKFKQWTYKGNEVKVWFLITSLLLIIVFQLSGVALCIVWYVLLSAIMNKKKA